MNKRVYATFDGHEALFVWLLAEAKKRGCGRKRTIFLADGADAIWRRQQRFFPKAEASLDWCHVEEKLWLAGTALHREGSPALAAWVSAQTDRLRAGHRTAVIRELRTARKAIAKTGPGNLRGAASATRRSRAICTSGGRNCGTARCWPRGWTSGLAPSREPCATSSRCCWMVRGCAGAWSAPSGCCTCAASS